MKNLTFKFSCFTYCLFTLGLLLFPNIIFSQDRSHFINKVSYFNDKNIDVKSFFQLEREELGLGKDSKMVFKTKTRDKMGFDHSRYSQQYKGLKVIGSSYILHSKNNKIIKTTGTVLPNINIDTDPGIDIFTAKFLAINKVKQSIFKREDDIDPTDKNLNCKGISLCIMDKNFPGYSGKYVLAYQMEVVSNHYRIPIKKKLYIDANSGETLLVYDEIFEEDAKGQGESIYYGNVQFNTDSVAENKFYLRDKTRGGGIFIHDGWNSWREFTDEDNIWNYNDQGMKSAVDAMYCAQAYYDFLKERFNRKSIDNNDYPLRITVNIKSYVNAYWDGQGASFGAGDCDNYNPLTTMSILGHEFTHGMTAFTSELIYKDESGAINESLSDIFGESLEYFNDNSNFEWTIGTRIPKGYDAEPFRSMSDPNLYGDPKYYKGKYWSTDFFDNGGVHSNSGILNYWFYLLTEGKSGISEQKDTFDVEALGIDKSLDIVYQMATNYLTENSGFGDAYKYSLEAATDLYGINSPEIDNIKEAWKAVGIPKQLNSGSNGNADYVDFRILINGKNELFETFCADELNNLQISLQNISSKVFPTGTEVNISLTPSVEIYDTFHFSKILEKDWEIDSIQSVSIIIDTLDRNQPHQYFNFRVNMELKKDSIIDKFTNFANINYRDIHEDYVGGVYIEETNSCLYTGNKIKSLRINLLNRGCRNFQEGDTIIIDFVSETDTSEFEINVSRSSIFFDFLSMRNIQDYIDFNYLENLRDYNIQLFYKSDEGISFVTEEKMGHFLHHPLAHNQIIDFEDDEFKSILGIKIEDFLIDTITTGHNLEIKTTARPSQIEDCLSYEDYFKVNKNGLFSFVTNIDFCSNLDSMKNPYLVFDVKYQSSHSDNPYYRMLEINQGETPIEYLVDFERNYTKKEIKLNKDMSSNINISVLILQSSIFIDNIRVIDKKSDKISDIDNKEFLVVNPISDVINIKNPANKRWNFKLYDVNGNIRLNKKSIFGDLKQDLNLASGIYFYRILSGKKNIQTGKIIVTR